MKLWPDDILRKSWSTRNMPVVLIDRCRRISLRTGMSLERVVAEAIRRGLPSLELERTLAEPSEIPFGKEESTG